MEFVLCVCVHVRVNRVTSDNLSLPYAYDRCDYLRACPRWHVLKVIAFFQPVKYRNLYWLVEMEVERERKKRRRKETPISISLFSFFLFYLFTNWSCTIDTWLKKYDTMVYIYIHIGRAHTWMHLPNRYFTRVSIHIRRDK